MNGTDTTLTSLQDLGKLGLDAKVSATIINMVLGKEEKRDAKLVSDCNKKIAESKSLLADAAAFNKEAIEYEKDANRLKELILQLEKELQTKRANAVENISNVEMISNLLKTYKGEKLTELEQNVRIAANEDVRKKFSSLYAKKESLNRDYAEALKLEKVKRTWANDAGKKGRALFSEAEAALRDAGLWHEKDAK